MGGNRGELLQLAIAPLKLLGRLLRGFFRRAAHLNLVTKGADHVIDGCGPLMDPLFEPIICRLQVGGGNVSEMDVPPQQNVTSDGQEQSQ